VKAFILAAGHPDRLAPLTHHLPTPMLPVVNRPAIEHVVELLARHDVQAIAVNLHHLPHVIETYLGDGRRWGVTLTYYLEREPLDVAGTLRRAADFLDETFLVLPGDAVMDLDVPDLLAGHREHGGPATAVVAPGDEGPVRTGAYVLEPTALAHLPAGAPFWPAAPEYHLPGYWNPLDTFAAYRQANADVLHGRAPGLRIPGVERPAGVWVGKNVSVHHSARVSPPALVGDDCQIRAGARLAEAVIGPGVVIDEEASVISSVILPGAYVGRLVEVRDSVVRTNTLVNAPTGVAVQVTDAFLLGESSVAYVGAGLRRLWDVVVALGALAVLGPVLVVLALWCRVAHGAALQRRACVAAGDPDQVFDLHTLAAGPALQRRGLHRLPALWNVVRGDLALVGGKPLTPEQAARIAREGGLPQYPAPPGWTGLWLVGGGAAGSWEETQVVDAYYAATRTFGADLRILARTPAALWRGAARETRST